MPDHFEQGFLALAVLRGGIGYHNSGHRLFKVWKMDGKSSCVFLRIGPNLVNKCGNIIVLLAGHSAKESEADTDEQDSS